MYSCLMQLVSDRGDVGPPQSHTDLDSVDYKAELIPLSCWSC